MHFNNVFLDVFELRMYMLGNHDLMPDLMLDNLLLVGKAKHAHVIGNHDLVPDLMLNNLLLDVNVWDLDDLFDELLE